MGQAVLQVSPKSGSARGSCSTVSKNRTRGRLPFSVRMNRSAQPLPSGALTRAGELPAPRNASSSWKTADMHWPPWSWRTRSPAAAPLAKVPERWRTPLAERRERLEAGAVSGGVDADALGAVVARGDEHRDLAFPGPGGGHADAPRHVQDGGHDGAAVVARSAGCRPARMPAERACAAAGAPRRACAAATSGHPDHNPPPLLAEEALAVLPEEPRDEGGQCLAPERTAVQLEHVAGSHRPLERCGAAARQGGQPVARRLADGRGAVLADAGGGGRQHGLPSRWRLS